MDISKPTTVDDYIALANNNVKEHLIQLRITVLEAAPNAEERISWEMPGYKLFGRVLIYFAGFSKHVSLFPGSEAIEMFKEELAGYKTNKGTIRFPLDKDIPTDLVKRIVEYRAKENEKLAKIKSKSTKK